MSATEVAKRSVQLANVVFVVVCVLIYYLSIGINTTILENVEHCGGEPEQADTKISCHW